MGAKAHPRRSLPNVSGPLETRRGLAFVPRLATAVGVEREVHEQRLVGPLRTGLARANVAVDANATENAFVIEIIGSRIAELRRIFQLATE